MYPSLLKKADRLSKDGDCDEAIPVYETAIHERPAGFEALTGLGLCELRLKDYSQARSSFEAALGASATDLDAIFGIAESYRLENSPTDATVYYKRYLEQAPSGDKAPLARRHLQALTPAVAHASAPQPAPFSRRAPSAPSPTTDGKPAASRAPKASAPLNPPADAARMQERVPAEATEVCRTDDVLCQYRKSQHRSPSGGKK